MLRQLIFNGVGTTFQYFEVHSHGYIFFIQCNFIHRIIFNNKGPYVKLTLLILTSPGFQLLNHNQFTAELKLNLCERDIILKRFAVEETAKELSMSVA